ncbi:TetR family transcriptional regulator [Mycobacterium sp. ACS1612]|uniref:TetR/AcrR family transcriptional regulator n=1 Tax=Mycobacterium sp. ACS1612 TaxID=1834117 RepID=UPI0007FD910D|nr:TetR/AcrR family transcriptional regulator [Mycobacterium sp. ACS1612]OBF35804.1 TetR family transcriptional regulator [Mycobacterium sp. ACS1612]
MAARTNSVDPRAERVRTLLRDAAFALAHERPVDALTVGDIVARAGVSRQVFYQHFTDRDDAVANAFTVAFSAATADISGDARARIARLFDFAAEHRSMYRNIVPSAVTQRVVTAFRAELLPACEEIAAQGMPVVSPIAGLTPKSVSRFLVGGFTEVLRDWMEEPGATDLSGRVRAALDTVNALLASSKEAENG